MADGKEEGKKEEVRKPTMTATAPPLQPLLPHFLVEGDIRQSVLRCVEHFLSRTYLEGDPLLVSQMNADLYVPLQFLVNSKLLPVFGELDLNSVIAAIQDSKEVSLDDTHTLVRPNFKLSRTTIILRDLVGVNEEEVMKLFKSNSFPFTPTNIVKEVGDNWFVSFSNEQEALDALSFIRKQKHNDKPIFARLKQESLLRTSFVTSVPIVSSIPLSSTTTTVPSPWESFNPFEQLNEPAEMSSNWDHSDEKDPSRRGHKGDRRGNRPYQRKGREGSSGDEKRGNDTRNRGNRRGEGGRAPIHSAGPNSGSNSHGGGRKSNTSSTKKSPNSSGPSAPLNLGPANFPPLHSPQRSEESEKQQSQQARPPLPDYRAVVSSKAAPPPSKVVAKQEPVKHENIPLKDSAHGKEKNSSKESKQDASSEFRVPRQRKKKGGPSAQSSQSEQQNSQDHKDEHPPQVKDNIAAESVSVNSSSSLEVAHAEAALVIHSKVDVPQSFSESSSSSSVAQPQSSSESSSSSSSSDSLHPIAESESNSKQPAEGNASGPSSSSLSAEQKKMSWASLASKSPSSK